MNSATAIAAASVPAASARDLGVELYTKDGWDAAASADKDPINLLFGHSLAPLGAALRFVEEVLGCRARRPSFGTQWFCEPDPGGPCHRHDEERATRTIALTTRYHTRLYQLSPPGRPFAKPLTAAPIHREVLDFCRGWVRRDRLGWPVMDVPDSFDAARDWARARAERQTSTYRAEELWLGNVEPVIQCDGTPVQSDGFACVLLGASDPPLRTGTGPFTDEWGVEWLTW